MSILPQRRFGGLLGQGVVSPEMPYPTSTGSQPNSVTPDALFALAASLGNSSREGLGFGEAIGKGGLTFKQVISQAEQNARAQKRQELADSLKIGQFDLSKKQFDQQVNQADRMFGLQERQFGLQERELGMRQQQEGAKIEAIRGLLGDDPQAIAAVMAGAPIKDVLIGKGILTAPVKVTETGEKNSRLANSVLSSLDGIEKLYFDDTGQTNVNRSAILNPLSGNGRSADQRIKRAIQDTIYLKSGAAAPQTEIDATAALYQPSALDSPEQVRQKLQGLRDFANSAVSGAKPAGGAIDFNSLPD